MTIDTREKIIQIASGLVQQRGFNAFSYADIADQLGIRKASVHYHFPAKDDLALAVVAQYRKNFVAHLEQICKSKAGYVDQLEQYCAVYRQTLQQERICLCGMSAAEVATLSEAIRVELRGFFEDQLQWLASVLMHIQKDHVMVASLAIESQAMVFLSALQGSLLVARSMGDKVFFDQSVQSLMASIRQ